MADSKPLDSALRIVLVDGRIDTPILHVDVPESILWEDFLQTLYIVTIPITTELIGPISTIRKEADEGLSIDDGDWWYRIVVPGAHQTRGAWMLLNTSGKLRGMMGGVYQRPGLANAFVEVEHQTQKDRVELRKQLNQAAEDEMAEEEQERIRVSRRTYYEQLTGAPTSASQLPTQLQYPVRRAASDPTTRAMIEADQAAAIRDAAPMSMARPLP